MLKLNILVTIFDIPFVYKSKKTNHGLGLEGNLKEIRNRVRQGRSYTHYKRVFSKKPIQFDND